MDSQLDMFSSDLDLLHMDVEVIVPGSSVQSDGNTSGKQEGLIRLFKDDKWDRLPLTLKEDEDLNFKDASRGVSLSNLIETAVDSIYAALLDGWTIANAVSFGKDSTCTLHLFLMALVRAVRNGDKISQHHHVLHSKTGIENPEVEWLADQNIASLKALIKKEKLPLTMVIARPGVTQSWTGRVLTGRGLPTFNNSSARQCTHELKITPSNQARNKFMKTLDKCVRDKVCLILGSRDAEGTIRAGNIAKMGGSAKKVVQSKSGAGLYVIKDWLQSDVWEFLLSAGSEDKYPLPSFHLNNNKIAELYKEATGECVIGGAEQKKSEACGARFGCYLCSVTGLDKSMVNMINSDYDRFGYMAGINRIQRYLAKRRYEWSDRHPIGRTIYEGGFIKLQPDVYSPKFLARLLHVCISMDFVEHERAAKVALDLNNGLIADNEYNQRMATPQFRLVTDEAIVHVDFMWSYHHFNDKPFHALEIFHRVWSGGELDLLEDEADQEVVLRTPIPKAQWVKVGAWGDGSLFEGLADPLSEMAYFDGGNDPRASRLVKTSNGMRNVVNFNETNEVRVEADAAAFIIWEEYPRLRERVMSGMYNVGYAAQFYLRFGAISLAKGKINLYQKMMTRGQTYNQLNLTGYQTMEGVSKRKDLKVITDERYKSILARKIKGRFKKVEWWLNLDFTIKVHIYNGTLLGLWIESQIKQEQDTDTNLKIETEAKHWFNFINDGLWYQTTLYSTFILLDKSDKSKSSVCSNIYNEYKTKRESIFEEIRNAYGHMEKSKVDEILGVILIKYQEIKNSLERGYSLSSDIYGHWPFKLSEDSPERLLRHVNVVIARVERNVDLSGYTQKGKSSPVSEIQLSLIA